MGTNIIPFENRKIMVSREIAEGKFDLTVSEISIIIAALGKVSQSKEMLEEDFHTVTVEDYMRLRGVDFNTAKDGLTLAAEKLWNSFVTVWDKRVEKNMQYRWITAKTEYIEGDVTFQFNPQLIPSLCQLKRYGTAALTDVGDFKHFASYRIYFMLLNHGYKTSSGIVEYSLTEFLGLLDLKNSCYVKEFGVFNQRILKPAIAELKTKGLVDITIEHVLKRKKVVGFRFVYKHLKNASK